MNLLATISSATRAGAFTRPLWLGMAAGALLPVAAGALFATYDLAARPIIIQNAQLCGYIYLLGEITLIVYAMLRGLDVWSIACALPRWAMVALGVFISTFWISSVTVSQHPASSFVLVIAWAIHLLFAAALYHLMRDVPLRALDMIWPGFIVGLAALTVMIVFHFTVLPVRLVGHEHQVDWRVAIPGFINVRLFGAWTGAIFAALIGRVWTMSESDPMRRRLYLATAFVFSLTFWTTTRAALLAGACIIPVAWWLTGRPRARSVWWGLPLYLVAGALLTLPLQPYSDPSYTFFEANNFTSIDGFATGRLSYWSALLTIGMNHPVFGSGMVSSRWLYPPFYIHPHNVLVEFLLNWGVVGSAAAMTLLIGSVWQAHRASRRIPKLLPFVLMTDCLILEGCFDGMFHFAQFIILILGGLAICLAKRGEAAVINPANPM